MVSEVGQDENDPAREGVIFPVVVGVLLHAAVAAPRQRAGVC
jgi:hypothetical protein